MLNNAEELPSILKNELRYETRKWGINLITPRTGPRPKHLAGKKPEFEPPPFVAKVKLDRTRRRKSNHFELHGRRSDQHLDALDGRLVEALEVPVHPPR